jgi:hypothetical protein
VILSALGALGGIIVAAATISPTTAISNLSEWITLLSGIRVPSVVLASILIPVVVIAIAGLSTLFVEALHRLIFRETLPGPGPHLPEGERAVDWEKIRADKAPRDNG